MERNNLFYLMTSSLLIIFLSCQFQNPLFAQYESPEVVIEIPAGKAKYSYADHKDIIGPSTIDIDENGDIYIGGATQILVYDKDGNHLRTMKFSRHFYPWITDIAVGTDNKLYVLAGSKDIYIIDKNLTDSPIGMSLTDTTNVSIITRYFFSAASLNALRRIWVTDDNQCLVGPTEEYYYFLREADVKINEKATNYNGYPSYTGRLTNLYHGIPLKSSHDTILLVDGWRAVDLKHVDVSKTMKIEKKQHPEIQYDERIHLKFLDILPPSKKERYSSVYASAVIASGEHDKLFVRISATPFKKYGTEIDQGRIKNENFSCIITKSGELIGMIDSIPKDLIASTNIMGRGKGFATTNDGRFYYLYTNGDKTDLSSCVTRVIRW